METTQDFKPLNGLINEQDTKDPKVRDDIIWRIYNSTTLPNKAIGGICGVSESYVVRLIRRKGIKATPRTYDLSQRP